MALALRAAYGRRGLAVIGLERDLLRGGYETVIGHDSSLEETVHLMVSRTWPGLTADR
ncbi:hypothetical protein [Nonomuraea africana]|uniref:Uncharacterized protein n=1 Tax=Nonomuraea africana TaxID=46171 RepID=A0ABR9KRY5_9ACTN|nr:hypothetical protein [Nonomuraea africana]MBE1564787.1 hypothetical protein [Nonomuraea africana]